MQMWKEEKDISASCSDPSFPFWLRGGHIASISSPFFSALAISATFVTLFSLSPAATVSPHFP